MKGSILSLLELFYSFTFRTPYPLIRVKVVISVDHFITEGILHQVIALISQKKNVLHKKAQNEKRAETIDVSRLYFEIIS